MRAFALSSPVAPASLAPFLPAPVSASPRPTPSPQFTNPGGQNVVGAGGDSYLLDPGVLRAAGGERGDELAALADRLEAPASAPPLPPSMTVYYATDYVVFRRSSYLSTLRMISVRTAGGECINGQGLQSLHAADGVQLLYKSGGEYESVAPTWDWEKLPGTTVQVGGTALNCSTADGDGQTVTVGGVTDGLTGLGFMDFSTTRYGQSLVAKKAYFMFEGVFVNLGAGITSAPAFRVTTTVESRLLDPAGVQVSTTGPAGLAPLAAGNHSWPAQVGGGSAPTFVAYHGGTGYAVGGVAGTGATVHLLNAQVTGNWSSVGTYQGPPAINEMFTLHIDHGQPPVAAGEFVYYVWPDVEEQVRAKCLRGAGRGGRRVGGRRTADCWEGRGW
jgi:hypothetical protein